MSQSQSSGWSGANSGWTAGGNSVNQSKEEGEFIIGAPSYGAYANASRNEAAFGEQVLRDAASGNTSVAQQQLRMGLGQAQRNAASMATGRGSNPLAQRAGIYSGAQMASQANMQSAALRAAEMQAAQQMRAQQMAAQVGYGMHMSDQELQAQMMQAQIHAQTYGINQGVEQADRDYYTNLVGTTAGAVAGGLMSDVRAKTDIEPLSAYQRFAPQKESGGILSSLSDRRAKQDAFLAGQRSVLQGYAAPDDPSVDRAATAQIQRQARGVAARLGGAYAPPPAPTMVLVETPAGFEERAPDQVVEGEPFVDAAGMAADRGRASDAMYGEDEAARQRMAESWKRLGLVTSDARAKEEARLAGRVEGLVAGLQRDDERTRALLTGGDPRRAALMQATRGLDPAAGMGGGPPRTPEDDTLESLRGYTYRYKPEAQAALGLPGDQRYGIMAQDLERTPLGATMVQDTPQGKAIDMKAATGGTLAMIGRLAERDKEQERRAALRDALLARRLESMEGR